jgi:hypothetical protein
VPTLYEYFGLIVFFWSREHLPIHVHIKYQGKAAVAEFYLKEGEIVEYRILKLKDSEMLPPQQLKLAKELIEFKKAEIVQKWIEYFVYNKNIETQVITNRIKK